MTKRVRYNGGTDSYYGCSKPTKLIIGKEYEVIYSRDRGWQTDYTLKGIEGEFNSVWFTEVSSTKVYMAIAMDLPIINQRFSCYKIDLSGELPKLIPWFTSRVKSIDYLGGNICQVTTRNSVYIVQIG